jgi:hypothetical protein
MSGLLQRIYASLIPKQAMGPQSRMGVNGKVPQNLSNLHQVVNRTPSTGVRG